jgi:hypothetical protein
MSRRARFVALALVAASVVLALLLYRPFPPDHTPEGAYARIAKAVSEQHPRDVFAYLEQDAQDAAFSTRDMRKAACDAIERSYPQGTERDALLAAYRPEASAVDGVDVFLLIDKQRAFLSRLRKDLSGFVSVETAGERATVVTARGTRYSFRRRANGVWGLTLFSAELLAESERAARDLASVRAAAEDYERAKAP